MTQSSVVFSIPDAASRTMVRTRSRYFMFVALAMLAVVLVGFAGSFYLRPLFSTHHALDLSGKSPLPMHVVVHGVFLTAWFVLFVVQTALITTHRTSIHRQLGIATSLVAIALVAVAVYTTVLALPRFANAGLPDLVATTVTLNNTVTLLAFVLFVSIALILRRRPEAHKRLMLIASLTLLPPAALRIGDVFFGQSVAALLVCQLLLLASLVIHDWKQRRRIHPVTYWGLVPLFGPPVLTGLLSPQLKVDIMTALGRLAGG